MCPPPAAALCGRATSPLFSVRYSVAQSVGKAGYRPAQASPGCRLVVVACVAQARCGHPLRFYITPHFVKWAPSAALKLRSVPPTAAAPSRVHKTGVTQSGLAGSGRNRHWRSPVAVAPYAPMADALCGVRCARAHGQALRAAFWSVACGHLFVFAPAHPWASPLRGIGLARVCPSAPQGGSLSPAHRVLPFCGSL